MGRTNGCLGIVAIARVGLPVAEHAARIVDAASLRSTVTSTASGGSLRRSFGLTAGAATYGA